MPEKKGEQSAEPVGRPAKEVIKGFQGIPKSFIDKLRPTANPFDEADAEKLAAAAMGGREKDELFPAPTPDKTSEAPAKKFEKKEDDLRALKLKLKDAENPPKAFEKIATPEQREERAREIKKLKEQIEIIKIAGAQTEKGKVEKLKKEAIKKIEGAGADLKGKKAEADKTLDEKVEAAGKRMETRIKEELSKDDVEIMKGKIADYRGYLKEARQKGDKENIKRLEQMIKATEANLYETVEVKPSKSSAEKRQGGKPEAESAQPESPMQRKTREYEEKHRQAMEIEIANLDQRDVELWSYRAANKKFDVASGDIPIHYRATPEIEKAVKNFLANRSMLTKAEQAHKKSGKKGGEEEMWLKNHELSTNRSLDVFKLSMFNDMIANKAGFLKSQGLSDKQVQEMMEKEEVPFFHNTIMSFARCAEGDLAKTRMEAITEPRERGMISRTMEKFHAMPKWKRLIVGGAVAGGIGAGIGLWGGAGLAVAAYIGGTKAARALFGGSLAAGINTVANFFIDRKYGKQKEAARAAQDKASLQRMQAEITKMKKEGKNWMEREEGKLRLMEMIDEDARNGNKGLQQIIARERRARGIAVLVSGLAGGLAAWATSANLDSIIGGKSAIAASMTGYEAGIDMEKPACFEIGDRGPEGSIIDYFRDNPDAAKSFGWDGETDLSKWSGVKAHQLWIEDASQALKNPDVVSRMEELGYSQDPEGYAEMMHRIGKGNVFLDPVHKQIDLVEVDYLENKEKLTVNI